MAFAGTDLPRAHVTGTPVRPELAPWSGRPRAGRASRVALGLPPDRQTVASVGGSLGARRINRAVAELAGAWAGRGERSLYHVTGRRDYEAFADRRRPRTADAGGTTGRGLRYRVVPFEDHMPDLYDAADVW